MAGLSVDSVTNNRLPSFLVSVGSMLTTLYPIPGSVHLISLARLPALLSNWPSIVTAV
jgi:hypothetical protein